MKWVPVITLTGESYAGRMGCSIMNHVGLSNMIAANEAEYVEKAVRLGRNKDGLAALRAGMRQRLLSSKICDIEQFGRDFTEAVYNMVRRKFTSTSRPFQPSHVQEVQT